MILAAREQFQSNCRTVKRKRRLAITWKESHKLENARTALGCSEVLDRLLGVRLRLAFTMAQDIQHDRSTVIKMFLQQLNSDHFVLKRHSADTSILELSQNHLPCLSTRSEARMTVRRRFARNEPTEVLAAGAKSNVILVIGDARWPNFSFH